MCLYHLRKEASKHGELVCATEVVGNSPSKLLKMSLCFASFLPCVFLSTLSPGEIPAGPGNALFIEVRGKASCPSRWKVQRTRVIPPKNPLGDLPPFPSTPEKIKHLCCFCWLLSWPQRYPLVPHPPCCPAKRGQEFPWH